MKHLKISIGIVALVFIFGIVAVAFGQGWNTPGRNGYMMGPGMMGYGSGYQGQMGSGMMGYGMMGYGMGYRNGMMGYGRYGYNTLSSENATKLQKAQQQFFNDTRELRNEIQEKELALNQELSKDSPNRDKALSLQKALSSLEAQFQQKELKYRIDLQKSFPGTALSSGYGNWGYCWR